MRGSSGESCREAVREEERGSFFFNNTKIEFIPSWAVWVDMLNPLKDNARLARGGSPASPSPPFHTLSKTTEAVPSKKPMSWGLLKISL